MGYAMLRYGIKYSDASNLYGKYVANWGGQATVWRFDAIKDGKTVASVIKCHSAKLHLEVKVSHTALREGDSYDMAAVRIRVLDEYNNLAPYAQLPIKLQLTGEAALIGPDVITAEGGMCGTYLRTTGKSGKATLTLSTAQTEPVTVEFDIT
jgi:beta-galactosidase